MHFMFYSRQELLRKNCFVAMANLGNKPTKTKAKVVAKFLKAPRFIR